MISPAYSRLLALSIALAWISACAVGAQEPPREPPRVGALELRLLDTEGRELADGAQVEVGIAWSAFSEPELYALIAFNEQPFERLTVGRAGRLDFPGIRPSADYSRIRRGELLVIARDAQGRRSRARRAWPVDAAAARPLELRLQPERELFRVRLVDSLGAAIPANAVSIHAASPDSEHLAHLLHGKAAHRDAPYVERGAENELGVWGWPVEGDWKFSASYIYHGPTSAPVVCACGTREVELVLPATGHAQLRTKLPRPFPNDALQAVYRHVASGSVARWMVLDGATNHRLLVGQHALSLELGGEPWLDLGLVEVPHGNTRELPIELPSALRSFKLFVQDAEDRELPAARVRRIHCGTPHGFHRDGGPPWGVLVATTEAKLDLQVECEGFEAERLFGVEGERVVVLRRIPR